jgi:hypothetical protein
MMAGMSAYGTSRQFGGCINLVAIGGEADMLRPPAPYRSDTNDPSLPFDDQFCCDATSTCGRPFAAGAAAVQ